MLLICLLSECFKVWRHADGLAFKQSGNVYAQPSCQGLYDIESWVSKSPLDLSDIAVGKLALVGQNLDGHPFGFPAAADIQPKFLPQLHRHRRLEIGKLRQSL